MYVIDPGHPNQSLNPQSSGYGAVYDGDVRLEEKNLTYTVAKNIQDYACDRGVRVELTRDKDEPKTLRNRCKFERKLKPDCFVSIHFNYFRTNEPRGSTIFYYPHSVEGEKLSESLDPYFQGYVTIPHRRIRVADNERDDDLTPYMYVLANTNSPAVLLELAFLSNPKDREKIINNREQFLKNYAEVIFWGLRFYSNTKGDA